MESLGLATKVCLQAFVLLSARLNARDEFRDKLEDVLEEGGRLRIWAANLGALASGHSALDWRLRDASVMRTAVLMLLHELKMLLDLSSAIVVDGTPPSATDDFVVENNYDDAISLPSDDGIDRVDITTSSKLEELIESVAETIEKLYRIAFRIRNPNNERAKSSKASRYREICDDGRDLFEHFAFFDRLHIVALLTDLRAGLTETPADDDVLISRLTESNIKRRRQFRYWSKHAQKLGSTYEVVAQEYTRPEQVVHKPPPVPEPPAPSTMEKSIRTTTEATKYDPKLDLETFDTRSVISSASTSRDLEGRVAELPSLPSGSANGKNFICPYCQILCPSRHGNRQSWRNHILQDLQPYLCTYSDCRDGQRIYGSRQDWFDHESLCHRRMWTCRDHPSLSFKTQTSLEQHLESTHADALPEHRRSEYANMCETTYDDDRERCPFCLSDTKDIPNMSNHLANHMERVATFSLPRHVDQDKPLDNRGSMAMSHEGSTGSWRTGSWQSGSVSSSEDDTPPRVPIFGDFTPLSDAVWDFSDVAKWLSGEGFSDSWRTAFDKLNIHGRRFLDLGKPGAMSTIRQEVLPEVIQAHGSTADQRTEEKESARLHMFISSIVIQGASIEGDYMLVEELIREGVDLSGHRETYGHALQKAAYGGHNAIINLLLLHGVDVNASGGYFGDALQTALAQGHHDTAGLLLKRGADVNAQGGHFGNALQAASAYCNQDIVELLERGADVNAQGGWYGSALHVASAKGNQEVVELLLERGADVNAQSERYGSALNVALWEGHQGIAGLLLERGAGVNAQGRSYGSTLQAAAVDGNREAVELLIERGADVNAQGGWFGNALSAALACGKHDVAKLLLERGADVNAQGGKYGSALQAAAGEGNREVVELLIERGADLNTRSGEHSNALQAASAYDHREIVELLLEKGIDVNTQGGDYGNALQAASLEGNREIVELLLERGADVNAQGGKSYSNALHAASARDHPEVVELLIERGADVNAQGGELYGNALQAASAWGNREVVKLLLGGGVEVNSQGGESYNSALQTASAHGREECVELLLERGADVIVQGGGLYSDALQAAYKAGHRKIVALLKAAMARAEAKKR